mgnify:FL=1
MAQADKKAKNEALIDPIYEKFVRGVTRAIGSTEFYEYFMDAVSHAQNEIQFSNRKLVKTVDLDWVDAIEEALPAMQNILAAPRNMIKEEDLIVNVANAKHSGAETVRHLAQHSGLVESFDEETGDVRPSRLMQRYREESLGLYENRLVFTTMEYAFHFVKIRHDALLEAMSDEFGAKLLVKSDMDSATEHVHMDLFLHIKDTESTLETDAKNADVFGRISRMYRVLGVFMNSAFAQSLAKKPRVKGTINKTNILKRNPNYREVLKLFEFLRSYDDIGYTIKVVEQSPQVDERFTEDIYRNILFQYLILKGYLEDPADRAVPVKSKDRRRVLKPKFIHEIVEELTEDYDLPDVEVRKVLIEELTKEQLMQEEAAERRRLVEEQAKRKKEEAERLKKEKEAEKERLKQEKEAEKERLRLEKEAEEARRRQAEMEQRTEDHRRAKLLRAELGYFREHLEEQKEKRAAAEDAQRKKREAKEAEEAELARREQLERLAAQDERERVRQAEEAARIAREKEAEKERIRAEKAEAERQRRAEAEAERARIALAQKGQARAALQPIVFETEAFAAALAARKQARKEAEQARYDMVAAWEREKAQRRAQRMRK